MEETALTYDELMEYIPKVYEREGGKYAHPFTEGMIYVLTSLGTITVKESHWAHERNEAFYNLYRNEDRDD